MNQNFKELNKMKQTTIRPKKQIKVKNKKGQI